MPPALLPDTNGVITDDFLLSVKAFVTKNVCKYHKHMYACVVSHRRGSLFFQFLYVAVAQIVQQPSFTSASFICVAVVLDG